MHAMLTTLPGSPMHFGRYALCCRTQETVRWSISNFTTRRKMQTIQVQIHYRNGREKPEMSGVNRWSANCLANNVPSDVREAYVHEVLEQHHARYEVRPYYVVLDQRPAGAPPREQRIQAGFDVDVYGTLEREQLPLYRSEGARTVVNYFQTIAQQIQSKVGQQCTIEVIPYADSMILDTHQHFQPQAMLRIRISHDRGLDQPEGPPEEQALMAIRETLHALE